MISKELMQDLMDVTNKTNPPGVINDAVSGVTISQLFAALQSDVTTVPQYRGRLILQNSGFSAKAVINLFGQYHY